MNILQRIEGIATLWKMMLPHIEQPSPVWICRWAASSSDAAIERGILRASQVFSLERHSSAVTPETVHKYCSGVIRHESQKATAQQ
jgi:hypothetical protein